MKPAAKIQTLAVCFIILSTVISTKVMPSLSSLFAKNLNGQYYPIIGIPDYIEIILSETIKFPKPPKPSLPIKPILELPSPPQPPTQSRFSKAIGLNMLHQSSMLEYYSRLNKYHEKHEPERTDHAEKMMRYDLAMNRYINEELPLYQRIIKLHKKLEAFLPINKLDRVGRAEIISAYLEIAPRPLEHTDDKLIYLFSEGITEPLFEKELIGKFGPESIVKHHTNGYSEYTDNDYCTILPDFILTIPKTNLNIAIEIDEPYDSSSFSPMHFLKDKSYQEDGWPNFTQEDMDFMLNECGWATIRFTERQIVEHTTDCIELIYSLANYLLQRSNADGIIHHMQQIPPEKRWSEHDAYLMARGKYRQSYLPDELLGKLLQIRDNYYMNRNPDDDLPF